MKIGLLRDRLSFQTKTETISAARAVSATWATAFEVWGRVKQEDANAGETPVGERPASQTKTTMIIRYDARVTTAMRVLWLGRVFEITGIINRDERRATLDLNVIERKSP